MALSQIASASAQLHKQCETISTQRKGLATVAKINMFMKGMEENVAFYYLAEQSMKSEPVVATAGEHGLVRYSTIFV